MQHLERPPENEATLSSTAAARRLGVFTSQLIGWCRDGLLRSGCYYRHANKKSLTWWVSHSDVVALIDEGGRHEGIRKRKQAQREQLTKGLTE